MNPFTSDCDLAVDFAWQKADAETELVAAILADPARAMPLVEAEGVCQFCFSQADLRLIFLAADLLRDSPLVDVIRLAKRALQADGFWFPCGPISFGSRWSDETLVRLACHAPYHAETTTMIARWLADLDRRERAARAAFDSFISAIKGAA